MTMENISTLKLDTPIKKTTTLDFLIHVLCFLSVLFIGADVLGINVGVNIRIDQLFLTLLTACLILNNSYRVKRSWPIIIFLLTTLLSTFFAINVIRASIYYLSIVFNVFIVFYCFTSYINCYGINKFFKIFRNTLYLQTVLIVIQFLLKVSLGLNIPLLQDYGYYFGIPRFCLWFYEPSYFATYFLFWFTLSFYNLVIYKNKGYLKDVTLALIGIFLSTSGTGYIGMFFAVALIYLIWIFKSISLKKILVMFLIIALGFLFYFLFKNVFDTFVGRIFEVDLNTATGGRVEQWAETYNVFKENILFGVGPGCYGLYLTGNTELVPSNVTLELMATTGLFAALAFYSLTVAYVVYSYRLNKKYNNKDTHLLISLVTSLIVFTFILQVNQGYLRLYHWMFFGIIEGLICIIRADVTNDNRNFNQN